MSALKKATRPSAAKRRIFVTGATGFVGSRLLPHLARDFDEVWVLVRPESIERAQRLYANLKNVNLVLGDLQNPGVLHVIDAAPLKSVRGCQDVLHLGASYDLGGTAGAAYLANVVGTQNLLDFCHTLTKLERFHHVSTIAIAGDFGGDYLEKMFNVGQKFHNPYAQTKFRAEGLVGSWKHDAKRIVYRLGVVVGDSLTGSIPKCDGPYYLLRALASFEKHLSALTRFGVLPLPFDRSATIPMIPVDALAEALGLMVSRPSTVPGRLRTYHLTGRAIGVEPFVRQALQALGYRARLVSLPRSLVPTAIPERLGIPSSLLDYMYGGCRYDTSHVTEDFPEVQFPDLDAFAPAMFDFARKTYGGKT